MAMRNWPTPIRTAEMKNSDIPERTQTRSHSCAVSGDVKGTVMCPFLRKVDAVTYESAPALSDLHP